MQRTIFTNVVLPPDQVNTVAVDENVIADHLEKYLQAEDNKNSSKVFHSVLGGIHLYCFPPSQILQRNYWTISTMGISGTKMNVPRDISEPSMFERCELILYLPGTWELPAALGGPLDAKNWPFELLRSIATYVGRTQAWISYDHGLPNLLSDPPGNKFLPNIDLTHLILLEPVFEEEGFASVITPEGHRVNLLVVIPLTAAEAAWKREVGAQNSIHYIVGSKAMGGDNVAVDVVIDPHRPCAVNDLHIPEELAAQSGDEEEENEDNDD